RDNREGGGIFAGSVGEARLCVGRFGHVPLADQFVADREQGRAEEQPEHAERGGAADHAEQDRIRGRSLPRLIRYGFSTLSVTRPAARLQTTTKIAHPIAPSK